MALYRYLGKRLAEAYKREPKRGILEWCEKEVVFTDLETSPILGNFKVKYSPQYKKLFLLVERTLTREIFAKWASQSGKSLFGVLVAAHKLDTLPATVIYAQPLKDDISTILQTKINPVLRSIPKLWKKFEDYKETEKIRTKDAAKKLAGGNFLVKGSGTKDRKSQTSPFIVLDEIGEFPEGAVFEFKERTKSYTKFHPKVIGLSTIVHPEDEICSNFDMCAIKLEWHFICPQCKQNFYPDIKYFKYPSSVEYRKEHNLEEQDMKMIDYIDDAKSKAHIECPNEDCKCKITTKIKDDMIFNDMMDWFIINKDGTTEILIVENLTTETSFGADMNSFGSYFVTYEDIVEQLIKADDNPIKKDKLYRGWFNRFYETQIEKISENDMLLLGNNLSEWTVPQDTYKLYMGVDTQKDHFWYEIRAYCYGKKSHTVSKGRLETFGDVEDVWEYAQNLEDEEGENYMCSKMGIDRRGYNQDGVKRTDEVDAFVEYMVSKWKNGDENRIYATEGHAALTGDKAFIISNSKDYSNNRKKIDIKIIKMSNLYLKGSVQRAIERAITKAKAETAEDDGFNYEANLFYINQDIVKEDMKKTTSISYTRQMTAEVFDYGKNKQGKMDKEKSWINPKQKDNHYFDTSVICEVFSEIDKINIQRKPSRENIEEAIRGLEDLNFS